MISSKPVLESRDSVGSVEKRPSKSTLLQEMPLVSDAVIVKHGILLASVENCNRNQAGIE